MQLTYSIKLWRHPLPVTQRLKERAMNYLPEELSIKLNKLTLDRAIALGLINDLGDANGELFIPIDGTSDRYFAIINGYKIICSRRLMAFSKEERDSWLGKMIFFRYEENGIYNFRLCTPVFVTPVNTINIKDFIAPQPD